MINHIALSITSLALYFGCNNNEKIWLFKRFLPLGVVVSIFLIHVVLSLALHAFSYGDPFNHAKVTALGFQQLPLPTSMLGGFLNTLMQTLLVSAIGWLLTGHKVVTVAIGSVFCVYYFNSMYLSAPSGEQLSKYNSLIMQCQFAKQEMQQLSLTPGDYSFDRMNRLTTYVEFRIKNKIC